MTILITGGSGMIGKALQQEIPDGVFLSSQDCDLRNYDQTLKTFEKYKPSRVIHLAAKVGGILANSNQLGDFYRDNILINTNVLEASMQCEVSKVVSLLSTCIYPNDCTYPLTENQLHLGEPHPSNYAYAFAKRMLDVQSRAYRHQFGCNFITAVPNNLFGEHDNFHYEDSHVIPAMIRKIHEANETGKDVIMWGTGSPLREFTYSQDLAKILVFLLQTYDEPEPINIGSTEEVSIRALAEKLAEILNFKGRIIWDDSKPDGQYRKPSDNSKLLSLGWKPENYKSFDKALAKTCDWFLRTYPNVRGVK